MKYDEFWFWFGVWTSILALVIAGTITFTGLLPDEWSPKIVKICADLFAINNVILAAAKTRGYLKARDGASLVSDAYTVAKALIAVFVLGTVLIAPATATPLPKARPAAASRRSLAEDHG